MWSFPQVPQPTICGFEVSGFPAERGTRTSTSHSLTTILPPATTQDPEVVRAWVTPQGATLCVDRRFTDWLGRDQVCGQMIIIVGREAP